VLTFIFHCSEAVSGQGTRLAQRNRIRRECYIADDRIISTEAMREQRDPKLSQAVRSDKRLRHAMVE
jgi:hypothetical protein